MITGLCNGRKTIVVGTRIYSDSVIFFSPEGGSFNESPGNGLSYVYNCASSRSSYNFLDTEEKIAKHFGIKAIDDDNSDMTLLLI